MKKAVVTFTLDEVGGKCRVKVDKDKGVRGMDLHSAIGGLYVDIAIKNGKLIGCLSAMIGHVSDNTGKAWRELLDEIKERMEEVDG